MPTVYSGNPANITTPIAASVAGTASGAGGVIVIQTVAAHNFANNDQVVIINVGGTTEANGTWFITVIDSTHFSLNGSTWVNAWTTSGTATDHSLTPSMQFPADGEAGTVASITASLQLLADRSQFLQIQSGYRIFNVVYLPTGSAGGSPVVTWTNASGFRNIGSGQAVTLQLGDVLLMHSSFNVLVDANTLPVYYQTVVDPLSANNNQFSTGPGTAPGVQVDYMVSLFATFTCINAGVHTILPRGQTPAAGGGTVAVYGQVGQVYLHLRHY